MTTAQFAGFGKGPSRCGLEHAVFESAKAVRKALEVHTPAVVMTDIRMPKKTDFLSRTSPRGLTKITRNCHDCAFRS